MKLTRSLTLRVSWSLRPQAGLAATNKVSAESGGEGGGDPRRRGRRSAGFLLGGGTPRFHLCFAFQSVLQRRVKRSRSALQRHGNEMPQSLTSAVILLNVFHYFFVEKLQQKDKEKNSPFSLKLNKCAKAQTRGLLLFFPSLLFFPAYLPDHFLVRANRGQQRAIMWRR